MAKKPSAKSAMKMWEKSPADKKQDAMKGAPREGSKADMKIDKAGAKKMAAKKKGK